MPYAQLNDIHGHVIRLAMASYICFIPAPYWRSGVMSIIKLM